jgi:hypothetical protein
MMRERDVLQLRWVYNYTSPRLCYHLTAISISSSSPWARYPSVLLNTYDPVLELRAKTVPCCHPPYYMLTRRVHGLDDGDD